MNPTTRPSKLFRFAKQEWSMRSLKLGEFRLVPATTYKKLDGDPARYDDELVKEQTISGSQTKVTLLSNGQRIKVVGDIHLRDEFTTNYYVLCFSTKLGDYMYDDFKGSDSCLVIHNTEEVCNRILHYSKMMLPNWIGIDDAVSYGGEHPIGAAFIKDIKYIFQNEWRFAWLPPNQVEKLSAFNITIGNIEQFAEVVSKTRA